MSQKIEKVLTECEVDLLRKVREYIESHDEDDCVVDILITYCEYNDADLQEVGELIQMDPDLFNYVKNNVKQMGYRLDI